MSTSSIPDIKERTLPTSFGKKNAREREKPPPPNLPIFTYPYCPSIIQIVRTWPNGMKQTPPPLCTHPYAAQALVHSPEKYKYVPVWHTTLESRTHIVGECEIYEEERDALEEGMRKLDVCDIEEFGRLESSEKTIAILGDRWWPQTAKQDGDRISKQFLCYYSMRMKRNERPNVAGVFIKSRNSAPSRKGCVVNGQIAIAAHHVV